MSNLITGNDTPKADSRASVASALMWLSRAALCAICVLGGFAVVETVLYAAAWGSSTDYSLVHRLFGAVVAAPLTAAFENLPTIIIFGFIWAFARYFATALAASSASPANTNS